MSAGRSREILVREPLPDGSRSEIYSLHLAVGRLQRTLLKGEARALDLRDYLPEQSAKSLASREKFLLVTTQLFMQRLARLTHVATPQPSFVGKQKFLADVQALGPVVDQLAASVSGVLGANYEEEMETVLRHMGYDSPMRTLI